MHHKIKLKKKTFQVLYVNKSQSLDKMYKLIEIHKLQN